MEDEEKTVAEVKQVSEQELVAEFYNGHYKKHFHLSKTATNIDILEQYQTFLSMRVGMGSRIYTQCCTNLKSLREAQKTKNADKMTILNIVLPGIISIGGTMAAVDMITAAEQTGSALNSRAIQLAMKPFNFIRNLGK